MKYPPSRFTKMAGCDSLLSQADSVWKMLDELAEADPEGYKKFISQKMKEGVEFYNPPEPCFCISTSMVIYNATVYSKNHGTNSVGTSLIKVIFFQLPEVITHKLFVNICGWERVPAPKSDQDPIPVMAGDIQSQEVHVGQPEFSVVDVIVNPVILKGVENNQDRKNLLVHVALDYIENSKSVRVSRKYRRLEMKYKGDAKQLRKYLRPQSQGTHTANSAGKSTVPSPNSLLQQLSTITISGSLAEAEEPSLFEKDSNKPKKAGLIQEISTTPHVEMVQVPKHELFLREADGSQPRRVLIKVDLPGVTSIANCHLDVSEVTQFNASFVVCYQVSVFLLHLVYC